MEKPRIVMPAGMAMIATMLTTANATANSALGSAKIHRQQHERQQRHRHNDQQERDLPPHFGPSAGYGYASHLLRRL
jgi:hypothetical protein